MNERMFCIMKTTITFRANEVAYINDVLGSYGSERRIKQICKSIHGISVSGVYINNGRAYVLTVEVPMILGICKIAMNHAPAIKGLVKALSGIKDTIEYLSRNISRDLKNLVREYE